MLSKKSTIVLIAALALCASACTTSRRATSSEVRSKMEEVRCDSVNEQMMVTVMDTLKEVTTITLVLRQTQEPTAPDDTVRMTTVTDRTRSHDRLMSEVRSKMEEVIIRTDTVYIQKDSLQFTVYGLQNPERLPVSSKQSTVSQILKWIFWILLILTVLIIVVRIFVFRR